MPVVRIINRILAEIDEPHGHQGGAAGRVRERVDEAAAGETHHRDPERGSAEATAPEGEGGVRAGGSAVHAITRPHACPAQGPHQAEAVPGQAGRRLTLPSTTRQ